MICRRLAGLLLVLSVAGCGANDANQGPGDASPLDAAPARSWRAPLQVSDAIDSKFARVALDDFGNTLVAWTQVASPPMVMFTERHHSETWAGANWVADGATTAEPSVAMNAHGDTVMAWVNKSTNLVEARLRRAGSDWGPAMALSTTPTPTYVSAPVVGIDADGDGVVVWRAHWSGASPSTWVAGTRFDGETNQWEPGQLISSRGVGSLALAIAPNGGGVVAWALPFEVRTANLGVLRGFESEVRVAGSYSETIDLAVATRDGGDAVVVWSSMNEAGLKVTAIRRIGTVWGTPVGLASALQTAAIAPAVTMTRDGDVAAAWHDQTSAWIVTAAASDQWAVPRTLDGGGQVASYPSLATDGAKQILAVWSQGATSDVLRPHFSSYDTATGIWSTPRPIAPTGLPPVSRTVIAVNTAAEVLVAWWSAGSSAQVWVSEFR